MSWISEYLVYPTPDFQIWLSWVKRSNLQLIQMELYWNVLQSCQTNIHGHGREISVGFYLAPDKTLFQPDRIGSFLIIHENICCGYSLEAPRWDASSEYPQHMFSWRNKENIYLIPILIKNYGFISIA